MAHFLKIIKVSSLKYKWKDYLMQKEIDLNEEESDVEFLTDSSSSENCQRCGFINKTSSAHTAKFLVLSLSGFIGGVLLTFVLFIFLYIGVNFSLRTTTYICGLASIILCLCLAFSSNARCYVLLALSEFFSKQGRQALLAYALFLAFTGPARNTMHNLGILSDSMTCGQEMVKRTLKQILEMMKLPFNPIKETVEKLTKTLRNFVEVMTTCMWSIKKIVISILNVIQKGSEWLESKVCICNKKAGTPYERCMKTFDNVIADCKAKFGGENVLCNVGEMTKAVCQSVKCFDFFCRKLASESTIEVIKRRFCVFDLRMKNVFYVSIEFNQTYRFETMAKNTTKEVPNSIIIKIKKKIEKLQYLFSYFGFAFSLLLPFLFIKAYIYKCNYLTSDRYDNVYISKYFFDLDLKRAAMDRETVLPLEYREKERYAKRTSIKLVKMEELRYTQSMFFLILASFKVITFLAIDYSLFWILLTMYEAGRDLTEVERSKLVVHVNGQGLLADLYRNLSKAFYVPENPNLHLRPLGCLPDPSRPDMRRYIQIGFLASLTWFLTLAEPYGLRLRSAVMSHYYPDRAKERAIWLYNHILRSRGSFITYARRQLRRKYCATAYQMEKETLTQRLFTGFPLLECVFGKSKQNNCILCGKSFNNECLKRCKTPDCPGRYDIRCYATLENVCTICRLPVEYGDVSDISEEIDSSEEEFRNEKSTDSGSETFLTFKEMEVRDRFRDVEANKLPDYAKLGDLYPKKAAVKRRLKEVLSRHIENARIKKMRKIQNKQTKYKQVKRKIRDLIKNLKWKKSQEILQKKSALKKKFMEKVETLRNFKENREREILLDVKRRSSKSKVTFKFDTEEGKSKYNALKKNLRAIIKKVKEKKNLL